MLDYPGKLACTVFTQGCNLRCPWCQNGGLVLPELFEDPQDPAEILARIEKRRRILEGVCVSGGEPTLQPDLKDFLKEIQALGLPVKLDSNGSRPEVLSELIEEGLIRAVAMDIKAAPDAYAKVTGMEALDITPYRESVALLLHAGLEYCEFRTTLVKGLHNEEQVRQIGQWLHGAPHWYLQSYEESDAVISRLNGKDAHFEGFSEEEMKAFLQIAASEVPGAALRYS